MAEGSPVAVWRLELFGGLRAARGESGPLLERFQTRKTEALLARLALNAGRPQDRDALVDLLWPDAPPDAGRNRLTQAVVWLRPLLEPHGTPRGSVLAADRQSVALRAEAVHVDVGEFEEALDRAAAQSDALDRASLLGKAVDLYRGPLLPRLDEEWVLVLRQNLLDRFLAALHALVAFEEGAGRYESALAYARRAQVTDPLSEEAHLDVIRLLASSGQASAARRQYREMERLLSDALGEEPSPAARALLRSLRPGESGAEVTTPPPTAPVTPAPEPPPLPAPLTRFFGRSDEIASLRALLSAADLRLVTLVGVGGAGKTRLALETARGFTLHGAPVPVWFLPLADLADARQIPDALADLMRLRRPAGAPPLDLVADALGAAPAAALLVLDNLEHLTAGGHAAGVVRALLERAPRLKVLSTSRQRLGVEGEHEWPVPPLPVPARAGADAARSESVLLFVDRARAVRPGFALTPENADTVARLCERLDGLPLALELCAAWAQTLTPAQMLAQLNRRFDLLVSRRSDIPARHRSLRAAVENSYLLLPPESQEFFVRLSVFRGGWTLAAAAAVCLGAAADGREEDADAASATLTTLRHITELRERSLVVAEEGDGGGEAADPDRTPYPAMRYRMLETLREFAAQQRTLSVDQEARRRHAAYFLRVAESAGRDALGSAAARSLARLDAESDNLRAALAFCAEGGAGGAAADGLRLAVALGLFWEVRGYAAEGQEWLDRLTPLVSEPADTDTGEVIARAALARARLARARADFDTARAAAEDALRRSTARGDRTGMAQALLVLASLAYTREGYADARAMQEEALRLARDAGDRQLAATALLGLGNVAMEEGEWDRAWTLYGECLDLYRAADNRVLVAATLNNMGLIARYRGDLDEALRLFTEDLEISRALANRASVAIVQLNLGTVLRLRGEHTAAARSLREALREAHEVGDRRAFAWTVKECGHLAGARGDHETAVRLLAASESLRHALGMSFKPADPDALEAACIEARAALGVATFDFLWASGSALSAAEAFADADAALTDA